MLIHLIWHFVKDHGTFRNVHVVITTYDTLKSEFGVFKPEAKKSKKKKEGDGKPEPDSGSDSEAYEYIPKVKSTRKTSSAKKKDALFHVKWWRVVLGMVTNSFM